MSAKAGRPTVEDDGMCFCCGTKNPVGLKLTFETLPNGRTRTYWTPRPEHQGFKDIVHGGLVSTLMDEVMIRHLYASGIRAVTAELSTRFLRPVRTGKRYRFESWLLEDKGRVVTAEMEGFEEESGERVATGSAKCVRVPGAERPEGVR
jgi:acyl-coenzyme A thioesterase PaaI-like protein